MFGGGLWTTGSYFFVPQTVFIQKRKLVPDIARVFWPDSSKAIPSLEKQTYYLLVRQSKFNFHVLLGLHRLAIQQGRQVPPVSRRLQGRSYQQWRPAQ